MTWQTLSHIVPDVPAMAPLLATLLLGIVLLVAAVGVVFGARALLGKKKSAPAAEA